MTSDASVAMREVRLGGQRLLLTPHNCFACGTLNVHGLQLDLHAGGNRCWTDLVLADRFEGWEGMAHGGIVCTILDEVMAWALVEHDVWAVTARMAVDFRRPVPIGRPIHAEGRVVEVRRRLITAEGRIKDAVDGAVLALATATFVGAPEARKQELKARYAVRLEADGPETPDSVEHG